MGWFTKSKPKETIPASVPAVITPKRGLSLSALRANFRRQFEAAKVDRLNSTWPVTSSSIDQDLFTQLQTLRTRSRDRSYNSPFAKKFLQMCSTHVVGPTGFSLQVRPLRPDGKVDTLDGNAIEKAFKKWSRPGNCDVTGTMSFNDICRLVITGMAREGEFLARKVYGNDSPFGYQLQVIEIDRLDIRKNEDLGNGRVIRMGVELNSARKPVAYWIRTRNPLDSMIYSESYSAYERVPANEIYHLFLRDRPEQTRGFPWMHAVLQNMKNLDAFDTAAIINARIGASKMGFYTSEDGNVNPLADEEDAEGNLTQEADPGRFDILPPGVKFEEWNPLYPSEMYGPFEKACLRQMASGLGVAYNTLSNDLEGVNFSSIRTGVLEERDNWMVIQNWIIEHFLDDHFSEWLRWALLTNSIKGPTGKPLPITQYDKFDAANWVGRRWQWVDPKADVEANKVAVDNGFKSRTDVIAEQGKDSDEVFRQIADDQDRIKEYGVEIYRGPAAAAPPAGDNPAKQKGE